MNKQYIQERIKADWEYNMPRYEMTLNFLRELYRGGRILEVGAFPYGFMIRAKEFNIEGLDLNISRGQDIIKTYNLNVAECDVEKDKFPFKDNTFSVILFNETLEHLHINPVHTLREIHRVLKKDGILMLSTPNAYHITKIIKYNLGFGLDADPYTEFEQLYKVGHAGHLREYTRRDVRSFLENTGFKVIKVRNFNFHSSYILFRFLMWINPRWRELQVFIAQKH